MSRFPGKKQKNFSSMEGVKNTKTLKIRLGSDEMTELEITPYEIHGPYCGRDIEGVFHCVCGKCKPKRSDYERLKSALIGFVERASGKDATPEETAVLPKVADVLSEMLK